VLAHRTTYTFTQSDGLTKSEKVRHNTLAAKTQWGILFARRLSHLHIHRSKPSCCHGRHSTPLLSSSAQTQHEEAIAAAMRAGTNRHHHKILLPELLLLLLLPLLLLQRTFSCVTTMRAMPMLMELTTIVAAPKPSRVAPDATKARPRAALAAIVPTCANSGDQRIH
jgi:hypothetical protein